MKHYSQVIVKPLVSEKGMTKIHSKNQYPFEVSMDSNKIEIQRAVEEKWGVRVVGVNTMVVSGKLKTRRHWQKGSRKDWKKAVVTLHKDDVIEFM